VYLTVLELNRRSRCSTTALGRAAALREASRRVLVVDLDPQANATAGLAVDVAEDGFTVNDVLYAGEPGLRGGRGASDRLGGAGHLPAGHRSAYLPPHLHSMVGTLAGGQRTPVFLMGTSWERHAWYLRLPCRPGSPWSGVVRIECSGDLSRSAVTALANLSQATLYAGTPRWSTKTLGHRKTCTQSPAWSAN
jgi:AAA domain